jgi:endoglucanase
MTIFNKTIIVLLVSLLAACGGSENPQSDKPTPNQPIALPKEKAWNMAQSMGPGVNFGNMLDAPKEGDWGVSVKTEYVQAAWDRGFRTVRLPVRWSNHAAPAYPYTVDTNFMSRVAGVVDQLLAKGFHVVLNMHHHRQLTGDVLDAGEFSVPEAVLEERFIAIWNQIGIHFANRSDKLLFELYNEPHGRLTPAKWNSLADTTLKQVRITNKERIVLIGPGGFSSPYMLSTLAMPNDPYLMATVHFYEPYAFTHQGLAWSSAPPVTGITCCDAEQASTIYAGIQHARYWSDATGYPVFLGEFGSFSTADMASRVQYTRLVRQTAAANRMPWAYWEFASSFGVYDPFQNAFRPELANALIGP